MAIKSEILVIGGGLAGITSAIAAARTGADVRLVCHKKTSLRQASGLIDSLGYVPPRTEPQAADEITQSRKDFRTVRANRGEYDGPLVRPSDGVNSLPERHPYSILGIEALQAGLQLFDDITGDRYCGSHTDRNALIPTFGGSIKPTARYPRAVSAGLASDDRPMCIVGFRSQTEFDGRLLASNLESADVPFSVSGIEVPFAESLQADARITRLAKAFDHDETLDGTPIREALAEAVKPQLDGADRVGFPAVLGDDQTEEVRADLSDRLGADIFEIPMGPPSLLGLRLEDHLYDALDAEGVQYETGNPVVDYEPDPTNDDRIDTVLVDHKGREVPYQANQYILATGGLVGKGIKSDRQCIREPLFDCHVPQPEDRYDWFVDDAFGDQPFAAFGVRPDTSMRPLAADGTPTFENLFAAGSVVGGADIAREKSASGVSLATGVVAGQRAASQLE
jgi:glycerol-3-phosphate dehydrogenase subunit B